MTNTARIEGFTASEAIKAPVKVATTGNITLNGEQTIDSQACVEGDRVLVRAQTDDTENGIYVVKANADWVRAKDFEGSRDVVQGTIVLVRLGTFATIFLKVTTADPVLIGTSSITFDSVNGAFTGTYTGSLVNSISRPINERLDDRVSLRNWGVAPGAGEDITTALDTALAAMLSSGRRGTLFIPPGDYTVTNNTVVAGLGIGIMGESGETATVLTYTATSGAAIQLKNRRQFIANIEIDASAARQAGSGIGLLFEGDDTADGKTDFFEAYKVYVRNQPGSGVAVVGSSHKGRLEEVYVRDCGQQGFQLDNGTLTSRTNKSIPGLIDIIRCTGLDNTGHGLLVGNDNDGTSNRAIRVRVTMSDFFRNAEAAGARKSADQCWVFGDNVVFRECAFSGLNQAQDTNTTRAILFHGRSNAAYHCRYLDMNTSAIRFETVSTYPTNGRVKELHVVQTIGSDLDPAVSIDTDIDNVKVSSFSRLGIARLTSDAAIPGMVVEPHIAAVNTADPNSTTTLAAASALKATLFANERAPFRLDLLVDGAAAADIKIDFTIPASAVITWGPVGNMKIDPSTGSLVVQDPVTSSTIAFGLNGTTRVISLVGEVRTAGVAGDLQLRFAQNSSDATPTRILAGSRMELMR